MNWGDMTFKRDEIPWEPTVQYGFSRVPILSKMEDALYWVTVRARLDYERSVKEILRG